MGLLIDKSDFQTGKYKVSLTRFADIDSYIDKYEEQCLMELLGVALFDLFKADLAGSPKVPASPIYQALYNPIREDFQGSVGLNWWDCFDWPFPGCYPSGIMVSDGMKEMLKGFIYFQYMRDEKVKVTPSGAVVGQSDNSREAGEHDIYNRYNEAVKSHTVIQYYILKHRTDYPTFNGRPKQLSYWV